MIKIDDEFRKLCPPLSKEEHKQLEENILKEGCRDPLVLWDDILIDGHNRHGICSKHNIDYKTINLSFLEREDVIDWMIDNQLGRRNLTPEQTSYLRGMKYNRLKQNKGGNKTSKKPKGQNAPSKIQRTSSKLSEEFGADERTIRRDAEFAGALDSIDNNIEDNIKGKILSRALKISKKDIIDIAKLEPDQQKQVFKNPDKSVKEKLKQIRQVEVKEQSSPNKEKYDYQLYDEDSIQWLDKQHDCDLLLTAPPDAIDASWLISGVKALKATGNAFIVLRNSPDELKKYLNVDLPDEWIISDIFSWTSNEENDYLPIGMPNGSWLAILNITNLESRKLNVSLDKLSIQVDNKQVLMVERLIRASTQKDDIVIDPFVMDNKLIMKVGTQLQRNASGNYIVETLTRC